MTMINPILIDKVRASLKGAKLAKFDASMAVLLESIALGGWTSRGAVKTRSGMYQGLCKGGNADRTVETCSAEWYAACGVGHCISYGNPVSFMSARDDYSDGSKHPFESMSHNERIALGIKVMRNAGELKKVSDDTVYAWIELCDQVADAMEMLDNTRPLPRVTEIGLSPKVTKTLTEMNLDIDLPSIRMAKIETRYRPAFDKNGQPLYKRNGQRAMEAYYVVVWTQGIEHNRSRFAHGSGCHACGKNIPSGRFVPVEAFDNRSKKLVSFWLGCDCAANIFGIKDEGLSKS